MLAQVQARAQEPVSVLLESALVLALGPGLVLPEQALEQALGLVLASAKEPAPGLAAVSDLIAEDFPKPDFLVLISFH